MPASVYERGRVIVYGKGGRRNHRRVGLSIASEISHFKDSVYVLERHESFGQETSSRNSEVIHAGIYYPKGSLKAKTCVEGKELIYEICARKNIPHKRRGKLIVATKNSEVQDIERLFDNALANGVRDLELLSKNRIRELEPYVKAEAAIYSKTTGIIDSHSLMKYYVFEAKQNGAAITYKAEVTGIKRVNAGYEVTISDANNEEFQFITEVLINCAGLESDRVAEMVGIDIEKQGYLLKYCKGQYFSLPAGKSRFINRLIYPVPHPKSAGLGIHATPNLAGIVRLGPDDKYIKRESIDYDVDEGAKTEFHKSVVGFLSFLKEDDLMPDTAGIRPKLQGPDETFRDFVIKEESDLGLPGFINLIGIESPGLTSSPSIARLVSDKLRGIKK